MTADVSTEGSFAQVFTAALRGDDCQVIGLGDPPAPLPIGEWRRAADAGDRALLEQCVGSTIDIGCGPGRMSRHLMDQGHGVLAIDVVDEAVQQARDRGVAALCRNVFSVLPGEGRWETALLADGNIGIGGDPMALLARACELIAPEGRVVVDLAEPGVGLLTRWATIRTAQASSRPFPWSIVGVDAVAGLAAEVGLGVLHAHRARPPLVRGPWQARVTLRLPKESDFTSRLRSPAVAARVGLWLGICFVVCFVTGLISHYAQAGSQPVPFPTSPSWGYRVTQGLHVISGTAAVPLLLIKLWSVYPKLFARPPFGRLGPLALDAAERVSIAVLVAAAIFQLATGLANSTQWYPWAFSFRSTHYAVAWVVIGSLALHVAVKLPIVRDVLATGIDDTRHDRPGADEPGVLSRRGLVRTAWLASTVAVLATAGGSVPLLRRVSVLAVTTGDGPGGIPINRTAREADVVVPATVRASGSAWSTATARWR